MIGYVTFEMDGRQLAGRLSDVREVVRAAGIGGLAGSRAPVTGLLVVRGTPVPVVDLRTGAEPGDTGDVLVLHTPDGLLGLAVDRVVAVLAPDALVPAEGVGTAGLPTYVLEVRRDTDGDPVLVVSLPALAGLTPIPTPTR